MPVVFALGLLALGGIVPDSLAPGEQLGAWHVALGGFAGDTARPNPAELLHRVAVELELGAPARAAALLDRYSLPRESAFRPTADRLYAEAQYALGDFATAARFFAAAAAQANGSLRGVLRTRSGDAFERAGLPRAAAVSYRAALRELPQVAGWIALRVAGLVRDTARAFELLEMAPPAARALALEKRAELLAAAGNTPAAVSVLADGGLTGRAARYALAGGDVSRARRLAYAALAGGDNGEAGIALSVLTQDLRPANRDERLAVARALQKRSRFGEAAAAFGRLVGDGDSAAATLVAWGSALEATGDRRRALAAYDLAVRSGGPESPSAEYARGRLVMRMGRTTAGVGALSAFVARYADHPAAPAALMAVADARFRLGDERRADSLSETIARRWPGSIPAAQARFRLAGRALERRDLVRAEGLYQAVVQDGGSDALAARFLLARLAERRGDAAGAREQWTKLAHDDPLGYYGTLARRVAHLPPLSFQNPGLAPSTPVVASQVAVMGLLDAVHFDLEGELLVEWLLAQDYSADEMVELSEGMLARGRPTVAATLGWRAARQLTLDDPRVLRVIFPWPWRRIIESEAREFGLDPYLLAAVIRQESGFRRAVTSRSGARGLMQLMPGTAAQTASRLGVSWREPLLIVPEANVHVGAAHLAMLLRRYHGDVVLALAAYNAGARPAERWVRERDVADAFWFVERIPYPETRGYVRSVMRNRAVYEALYPPVAVR